MFLTRLSEIRLFWLSNRGNPSEVLLDQLARLSSIEIAHNRQGCVVRSVIGLEELLDIGKRGGFDIPQVTIEVVRVIPIGVGILRHVEPRESAIRAVKHVDLHLIPDYALLVLEIVFIDGESAHAIRFRPEHRL